MKRSCLRGIFCSSTSNDDNHSDCAPPKEPESSKGDEKKKENETDDEQDNLSYPVPLSVDLEYSQGRNEEEIDNRMESLGSNEDMDTSRFGEDCCDADFQKKPSGKTRSQGGKVGLLMKAPKMARFEKKVHYWGGSVESLSSTNGSASGKQTNPSKRTESFHSLLSVGEDDTGWYSNDGSPSTPTPFALPAMTSSESRASNKTIRRNQNIQNITTTQINLEQRFEELQSELSLALNLKQKYEETVHEKDSKISELNQKIAQCQTNLAIHCNTIESLEERLSVEEAISIRRKTELDDTRILNETIRLENLTVVDQLEQTRSERDKYKEMIETCRKEYNEKTENMSQCHEERLQHLKDYYITCLVDKDKKISMLKDQIDNANLENKNAIAQLKSQILSLQCSLQEEKPASLTAAAAAATTTSNTSTSTSSIPSITLKTFSKSSSSPSYSPTSQSKPLQPGWEKPGIGGTAAAPSQPATGARSDGGKILAMATGAEGGGSGAGAGGLGSDGNAGSTGLVVGVGGGGSAGGGSGYSPGNGGGGKNQRNSNSSSYMATLECNVLKLKVELEEVRLSKDEKINEIKQEMSEAVSEKEDAIRSLTDEVERILVEKEANSKAFCKELAEIAEEKDSTINKLRSEICWLKTDSDSCRRRHLEDVNKIRREKQLEIDRLQSEFGLFKDETEAENRKLTEEISHIKVERDQQVNTIKCDLQQEREQKQIILASLQTEVASVREQKNAELIRLKDELENARNECLQTAKELSSHIEQLKDQHAAEVNELTKKIQLLEQEKRAGERQLEKLIGRLDKDKYTVKYSVQKSFEDKDKTIETLREQLRVAREEKAHELEQLREALQHERSLHQEEINQLESEIERTKRERDSLTDTWKRDLGKMKQERKGLESGLKGELDKVKRDRNVEIETLKEELRMLREDNRRLQESRANQQRCDRGCSSGVNWNNLPSGGAPNQGQISSFANMGAPTCNLTSPAEDDLDCYREHARKIKDAKDREIILLETELRKVRLEKDKQILELKEEIKKLETMKRSEIAASKRDLQVLLEQQEKNWKTKFFVNSSENVLEAPPTHPSEYRSCTSSQISTAKSSKLNNPLASSLGGDTVEVSSCSSQGYRPSYQAPDSSKKIISSSFASSSQKPPGGGAGGSIPAPHSSTSKQTSHQSGQESKAMSSGSHQHHSSKPSQSSPTGASRLAQKALEAKEREIRHLEAELSKLRGKLESVTNSANSSSFSQRHSRSRDSSTSRVEENLYLEKSATLHRPSFEPVTSSSRKHGRREHSADRASLRHSSRISHYAGRASHHINPPAARIGSSNANSNSRTVTIAGNESDSGFSSTNHTPKDYLLMESVARSNNMRFSATLPRPERSSLLPSSSKLKSSSTTAGANQALLLSPTLLPSTVGEEIEHREDHIKLLESEKQRLEECLNSKDEQIRSLENQIALQQAHTLSHNCHDAILMTSSQLTSRSGSYLPHSTINGFSSPVEVFERSTNEDQITSYQGSFERTYEEVCELTNHRSPQFSPPLIVSSYTTSVNVANQSNNNPPASLSRIGSLAQQTNDMMPSTSFSGVNSKFGTHKMPQQNSNTSATMPAQSQSSRGRSLQKSSRKQNHGGSAMNRISAALNNPSSNFVAYSSTFNNERGTDSSHSGDTSSTSNRFESQRKRGSRTSSDSTVSPTLDSFVDYPPPCSISGSSSHKTTQFSSPVSNTNTQTTFTTTPNDGQPPPAPMPLPPPPPQASSICAATTPATDQFHSFQSTTDNQLTIWPKPPHSALTSSIAAHHQSVNTFNANFKSSKDDTAAECVPKAANNSNSEHSAATAAPSPSSQSSDKQP